MKTNLYSHRLRRVIVGLLIGLACWGGTMPEAKAGITGQLVTDLEAIGASISHGAMTVYGWAQDAAEWVATQATNLDQLVKLIENNVITKVIRGLNELMTAIQTDISDVLGTIETLASAPGEIIGSIMSLVDIPKSLFGMVQNLGSEFMGIYDDVISGFGLIGEAQALGKDFAGAFESAGGAYGFMNQVGGLRNSSNAKWLKGSQSRNQKVQKWSKAKYGKDQAQLQSTQIDILAEQLRQSYAQQDKQALTEMYESAKDIAAEQVWKSRTAKTGTQTASWFASQFGF